PSPPLPPESLPPEGVTPPVPPPVAIIVPPAPIGGAPPVLVTSPPVPGAAPPEASPPWEPPSSVPEQAPKDKLKAQAIEITRTDVMGRFPVVGGMVEPRGRLGRNWWERCTSSPRSRAGARRAACPALRLGVPRAGRRRTKRTPHREKMQAGVQFVGGGAAARSLQAMGYGSYGEPR